MYRSKGCDVLLKISMTALVWVMLLASGVSRSQAGPITFSSALPVATGEFILREQVVVLRSTDDPGPEDRDLRVLAVPSVLAYGVTRDLALFGIVPYLDKTRLTTEGGQRRRRGDSGLGDAIVLGRYTIYSRDRLGETRRLAPFVGLKLPTGEDNATDSFGRLDQPLQLGSGSWDPIVGTSFSWQTFDWEFDSAVQYRFNNTANNFEFGDQARLDLSFQYRLWPRELGTGVPAFFYGVLESNLISAGKNEEGGISKPDSGGTTWFLAPGLQYVTRRVVLEVIVQIPAVQDLNGLALKNDYIVSTGFRVNF
ncbi:transporter [Nitrospiraceae bacterium AH_259_D15_M11_P09]|nr:transporter [Nitrospiraceae bacterium AH_259_D15_M11_P09]